MRIKDETQDYTPTTKTILDIPTATAFFSDPKSITKTIQESVHRIVDQWNEAYENKPEVNTYKF